MDYFNYSSSTLVEDSNELDSTELKQVHLICVNLSSSRGGGSGASVGRFFLRFAPKFSKKQKQAFQHWAVQIGDYVVELKRNRDKSLFSGEKYVVNVERKDEWESILDGADLEEHLLGDTSLSVNDYHGVGKAASAKCLSFTDSSASTN
jgi:hypothetical protein